MEFISIFAAMKCNIIELKAVIKKPEAANSLKKTNKRIIKIKNSVVKNDKTENTENQKEAFTFQSAW